ncbi:selenide, water dikinase [Gemmobacter aquatilis]|uniref:Selenide, water dikinase n=2 Tax=Gemmobacter aquatilis TaxID=933059 RepID=A0A1H8KNU6_9RHOB|nr:selenide, water dikinase [Gemmobacter aquatilis]
MQTYPLTRDLVLMGGGHAHALLLRMWGMDPLPGVRVTVVNPGPVAPYTGMLPGHIAGHYRRDEMMIDLVALARFAGARVILDRVEGIDRAAGRVHLAGRGPVAYDLASIDIGISSELPEIAGYAAHGVSAKPLGGYAAAWEAFVARGLAVPRVVILGAGIGGVELALASAHRLRAAGARPEVTLLEREATALPHIGAGARRALLAELAREGVRLMTGARAVRIAAGAVELDGGQSLPSDFTLSVAGSRPQGWLAETGLALHEGFVAVGPTLQSSDPAIFAAGDCAHLTHAPRPKAGVFAVREAPILSHNLRVALSEQGRMRNYQPQRDYLKLVSTGRRNAVADKFGLRLSHPWLWRWKDRIDRRFMAMFAAYPQMAQPALPSPAAAGLAEALGPKPLCGGCGAKVGAADLARALASLPAPRNPAVLTGPGDDAAVIAQGTGYEVLTTDHLRAFTADHGLMARITALHAMGDIWAMGAAPVAALAQITLPRMSERLQAETLREIMAVAATTFREAGADIVGGHTSIGAELTIGFTVTGWAERVIAKGGARVGDVLVLTKPLGTGTLLAAEMAGTALPGGLLGEAVAGAFASMTSSPALAAAILREGATALTDVTGFGLAGHLMEICEASGTAATLSLAEIPLLPGAAALAALGVASTLAPANRAALIGRIAAPTTPEAALLFDPQTAGGFLAALPAARADSTMAALLHAGIPAARIGTVTEGPPRITAR